MSNIATELFLDTLSKCALLFFKVGRRHIDDTVVYFNKHVGRYFCAQLFFLFLQLFLFRDLSD